jgi:hypothetical protein
MTRSNGIDPSDEDLIDRCIAKTASSVRFPKALQRELLKLLEIRSEPSDIYNSVWPGLGDTVILVSAIPVENVIARVHDEFADLAEAEPEELVDAFRSAWEEIMESGSGFFARELRGSEGRKAWLVLSPVDGGGYDFHGIFSSPLAAEEHFRAQGWVFSRDPRGYPYSEPVPTWEQVPSGHWDGYTDEEALTLVRGLGT